MNKKIIIFACLGLLLSLPLTAEARGGWYCKENFRSKSYGSLY